MSKSTTQLRSLSAAAVAMAAAFATTAAFAAAPPFKVNESSNGLGGSTTPFTATAVNGGSTALITLASPNTYISQGFITYGQFVNAGSPAFGSTLNNTYALYATFTQTFSCPGALTTGTTCNVSSITLKLFADPGHNDTYSEAAIGHAPTVTDPGGDILLASANAVISGTAGIDAQGGAFENVITNFALTAPGTAYFVDPVPFYSFAFSAFNNTAQGIACSPNCANPNQLAITSESGVSDFASVPEPGSIALAAVGFFSLAAFSRRRKSKTR